MKKSNDISTYFSTRGPMHLKQILATLILALVISPAAVSAGIYKWTDENGKIHYGSERPEDAQAEKMKLHVPEPATSPEKAEKTEETDEADATDMTEDDKAKKERVAYCASERKRLQTVGKNKEIHEKDDKGEVKKLSAEARNQRLDKIKANISKYCK
ncbi:MAG: DUF4124 domain-containing protein [Gammaproteobacteria bacterium]|nr:DUF4124 domain-containing protein [Gammaproteobacteria bacterium]